VREGRELGSKLNYRRSPAAENQPTNPPSSNPISGANRTSVVTLTRIPSATPTAAPRTTAQMRLRSLLVPFAIGDRILAPEGLRVKRGGLRGPRSGPNHRASCLARSRVCIFGSP
jgi:hypothetical protein